MIKWIYCVFCGDEVTLNSYAGKDDYVCHTCRTVYEVDLNPTEFTVKLKHAKIT